MKNLFFSNKFQIERVKFGAPLDEVCTTHNDIPAPLLILILKVNKEGPYKKDVFRAPGHHANMKKLMLNLQSGRLVNIDHYNVYTIASVLKKFLRKLPGGIFCVENENRLFNCIESTQLGIREKQENISRLINSLPVVNQRLLVLLFGTFNAISSLADIQKTGMSSEALGVSVAPSFFHSCTPCKVARMDDVKKYKLATSVTKFLIDNFGVNNLFGINNYDYYGKLSGRISRRSDNWELIWYKYPNTSINAMPTERRLNEPCSSTSGALRNSKLMNKNISSNDPQCSSSGCGTQCTSSAKVDSFSKDRHDCLMNSEKQPFSLHSMDSKFHHHSTSSSFTHHSMNNHPTAHSSHDAQEHHNHHYNSLTDDIYGRLSMSLEDNVFKTNSGLISASGHYSSSTNSPCNVSTTSTPSNVCSPLGDLTTESLSGIYDQRQISLPLHYSTQCSPEQQRHYQQTKSDKSNDAMIEEEIKNLDQLKTLNIFAESTKSLTYLPIVHERQTKRMNARSEWFLHPSEQSAAKSDDDLCASSIYGGVSSKSGAGASGSSSHYYSKDTGVNSTRSIIRKTSSKDKRIIRRTSSKKDKENGAQSTGQQTQQTSAPRSFGVLSTDASTLSRDDNKLASSYKPRL